MNATVQCLVFACSSAITTGGTTVYADGGRSRGRRHPPGTQALCDWRERDVADLGGRRVRSLTARGSDVIHIDALWLCTKPVEMSCGAERLLAHVVHALGSANAHHGYVFANVQATRIKMFVNDGIDVWCTARRLNVGRFV